jgi:oligopeptide transport system substrate-binding protein
MHWTRNNRANASVVNARLVTAVVVALGCAPLCACPSPPDRPRYLGHGHTTPQRGGTLSFYHTSDVRGLDPQVAFDELSTMGIKLLFDGLLDYDEHGALIPRLAESMPEVSDDGLRYEFRLRPHVRFHNGRVMTTEDVRWTLEHMLAPSTGSAGYTFFALLDGVDEFRAGHAMHIAGIEVLDEARIAFRLRQPDQTFLHAMAMTFAHPVPKENYDAHPNDVSRHPVGTGPYMLQSWEPGVRLVFQRNPHYWQAGKPYVDTMVYWVNLSREAAIMKFRNGELDLAHRFSAPDYLFFRTAPAWRPYVVQEPEVNLWGLTMNCGMHPFSNRHVRRAVAFAIDRERWNKAKNFRLNLTGQPIPPSLLGHDPALPSQHHYDLARARQEMRLAGYPNGLSEPVTFWTNEDASGQQYGELLQEDLKKIGIQVEIKQTSFPVYLEETGKPGKAQIFLSGWSQDFPDPADFMDILFHSRAIHEHDSENRSFYRNPNLDRVLDQARVESNPEKRRALYIQAQTMVTEDAPWVFLWNDIKMEAWQPYVRGYHPHPVWSQCYRDVWLDLPRRRNHAAHHRMTSATGSATP